MMPPNNRGGRPGGRGPNRGGGRGPSRGPSRGPNRGQSQGPFRGAAGRGRGRPGGGRNDRDGGILRTAPRPRVVFLDDDVIVVDKAPGLPVALPPGEHASVPNLLASVRTFLSREGLPARVWFVHHIEPGASGLVAFARNDAAREAVREQFRSGTARLRYRALLPGDWPADASPTRSLNSWLVRGPAGLVATDSAVAPSRGEGRGQAREGTLHVNLIQRVEGGVYARVRVAPGLPGQLMAQLDLMGYAEERARGSGGGRTAILHAAELTLNHPVTGKAAHFQLDDPPAIARVVARVPTPAKPADEVPVDATPAEPKAVGPVALDPAAPHAAHLDAAAPQVPAAQETHKGADVSQVDHADDRPADVAATDMGWDHVAKWYDRLLEERTSDLYAEVVLPGTLGLLGNIEGKRVLDVACGQGQLCRLLAERGGELTGLDAAPRLIDFARSRGPADIAYHVGDARAIDAKLQGFDRATCVMALMNIEPFAPVVEGIAQALRVGGSAVLVVLHPGFRVPKHSDWAWDGTIRQSRRVWAYLSDRQIPVTMNPGAASSGAEEVTTWTYHRPVQAYFNALADAGLAVERVEEWASHRRSEPGPRAEAEDRARREIPMFLAIRARRLESAIGDTL